MRGLVTANAEALGQVLSLIDAAKDTAYVDIADGMTSSMGKHVRHVLDHYAALQTGMLVGEIDYDQRSRESEIERNSQLAKQQVLGLVEWLNTAITQDVTLKMKTEISVSSQQCITIDSSLKRELIYLLNHTVHHMAQVSLALRIMGIDTGAEIGIAPATLTYLRNSEMRQAS